jgi:hypothetical protein
MLWIPWYKRGNFCCKTMWWHGRIQCQKSAQWRGDNPLFSVLVPNTVYSVDTNTFPDIFGNAIEYNGLLPWHRSFLAVYGYIYYIIFPVFIFSNVTSYMLQYNFLLSISFTIKFEITPERDDKLEKSNFY